MITTSNTNSNTSDSGYRVASISSDRIAQVLFDQSVPLTRLSTERLLSTRVEQYWEMLHLRHEAGTLSDESLAYRLSALDSFIAGKLSGAPLLHLAQVAEQEYPNFIALMPQCLAELYEQLRAARLWSALLNPESLRRLAEAVERERTLGQEV